MLLIAACDPEVPPGMLCSLMATHGEPHRMWFPGDQPDLAGIRGIIILGGRMRANDEDNHPFLADLKKMVREAEDGDIPVLGLCLGGQIIAEALGGRLVPSRFGEKGITGATLTPLGIDDPLFEGVPYKFVTFEWHNDSIEPPEGGVLLAVSQTCPVQAFRYGINVYGLQFHPEITGHTAYQWTMEENNPELAEELDKNLAAHITSGNRILENFMEIVRENSPRQGHLAPL